jgi:hypothetical protein
MSSTQMDQLAQVAQSLFETSRGIFWSGLPVALLLAFLMMYLSGQISGAKVESILRRLLVAVALMVAFPEISALMTQLDHSLVAAFGGEASLQQIFSTAADHAKDVREAGVSFWIKVGQMGLSVITTVSFVILAFIQKFLMVLRAVIWNLLHILGPIAFLGCLFPSFEQIPKGIFIGLLEIALWRPLWIILCRLLLAIGFGEVSTDVSQWLDLAIMNFAVATLMASTPALVHGFLSGTLAGVGGSTVQSMAGGAGALLAGAPGLVAKKGLDIGKKRIAAPIARNLFKKPAQQLTAKITQKFKRPEPKPKNTQTRK